MIRLKYIHKFGRSPDLTWDNVIPALWSMIEICVATLCACLPAMRVLFSLRFPKLFDIGSSGRSRSKSHNHDGRSNPLTDRSTLASSARRSFYGRLEVNSRGRVVQVSGSGPREIPDLRKSQSVTKIWDDQHKDQTVKLESDDGDSSQVLDDWETEHGVPLENVAPTATWPVIGNEEEYLAREKGPDQKMGN